MQKTYHSYLKFLQSERVQKLTNFGVFPQRILWASTGTKDPAASDVLYISNLIAPYSVNTMPENTLLAYADHGQTGEPLSVDKSAAEKLISRIEGFSVNYLALADQLQREGAESFNKSWNNLIGSIATKKSSIK